METDSVEANTGKYQLSLSPSCRAAGTVTPQADRRAQRNMLVWLFPIIAATGAAYSMIGTIWATIACVSGLTVLWTFLTKARQRRRALWTTPFPPHYEKILLRRIPHYRSLAASGRELFRQRTKLFLSEVVFHGADVKVTNGLRLRAAAAAVVPTLGFSEWEWPQLKEIIFRLDGYEEGSYQEEDGVVVEFEESGMLGVSGVMAGTMMLSARDLIYEFAYPEEGGNVGFHEFAHLMAAQGLSLAAEDREQWPALLRSEFSRIRRNESLLSEYALLNEDEFFAVASELFFTTPLRFRNWHSELHAVLTRCYRQDPATWLDTGEPAPDSPPRRRKRRAGKGAAHKKRLYL